MECYIKKVERVFKKEGSDAEGIHYFDYYLNVPEIQYSTKISLPVDRFARKILKQYLDQVCENESK